MLRNVNFYKSGYQILRRKILEDFYVRIFNDMDSIADDFQKIIDYHTDDKIVDTIDYLFELIDATELKEKLESLRDYIHNTCETFEAIHDTAVLNKLGFIKDYYDNMYDNIAKVANQQDKAKNNNEKILYQADEIHLFYELFFIPKKPDEVISDKTPKYSHRTKNDGSVFFIRAFDYISSYLMLLEREFELDVSFIPETVPNDNEETPVN